MGHAFYPEIGEIHLDDDEKFTVQSKDGINLLFVVLHELGHALGLAHSSNIDAIMGPFYMGYEPNLKLSADDIAGIQFLYGKTNQTILTITSRLIYIYIYIYVLFIGMVTELIGMNINFEFKILILNFEFNLR